MQDALAVTVNLLNPEPATAEAAAKVISAAIQSLGILRVESAREPIIRFAQDVTLRRPVLFALARINNEECRKFLEEVQAALEGKTGEQGELRKLVDWKKTVKAWPDEIDEWTHYLHDGTNNAVADDTLVGPPDRLRWIGSPDHVRHHNPRRQPGPAGG